MCHHVELCPLTPGSCANLIRAKLSQMLGSWGDRRQILPQILSSAEPPTSPRRLPRRYCAQRSPGGRTLCITLRLWPQTSALAPGGLGWTPRKSPFHGARNSQDSGAKASRAASSLRPRAHTSYSDLTTPLVREGSPEHGSSEKDKHKSVRGRARESAFAVRAGAQLAGRHPSFQDGRRLGAAMACRSL